jgi:CRISPR-associated protein Cmr3
MAAVRFALSPRDGMFFKDGRGWYTSDSGRGHAVPWPYPSTLLGAIRTAWGRAVEAAEGRIFTPDDWLERTKNITIGTVVALRRARGEAWSPSHRMWPVPADALCSGTSRSVHRLDPIPRKIPTLGREDDLAREALWRPDMPQGKPEVAPAFWTDTELSAWLCDRPVSKLHAEERETRSMTTRIDLRIGIDPELGTVSEGALFATETVETLQRVGDDVFEWGIGIEAQLPEGGNGLARIFTLGSDRRLATSEPLPEAVFAPPPSMDLRDTPGLRMIVVSPACFSAGWLPDGFEKHGNEYRGHLAGVTSEVVLRAAFVPRATHVSGWDMARRRPKRTRRLVPPGAVYFFQKAERAAFTANEMAGLWLQAIGTQEDRDEGFGRVIAGPWETS